MPYSISRPALSCALTLASCLGSAQALLPAMKAPSFSGVKWLTRPSPAYTDLQLVTFWRPVGKANGAAFAMLKAVPGSVEQVWVLEGKAEGRREVGDPSLHAIWGTDPDGVCNKTWIAPCGLADPQFLPLSFILGNSGVIQWIGSTLDAPDVLTKIQHGRWDAQAFRPVYREQVVHLRNALAKLRNPVVSYMVACEQLVHAGKYHEALAKLHRPPNLPDVARFETLMLSLQSYEGLGDMSGYYVRLAKGTTEFSGNAAALNMMAWGIADPQSHLQTKRYDVALKISLRSNALANRRHATYLDTLAWTYWGLGQKQQARSVEAEASRWALPNDAAMIKASLAAFGS